jgi:hypothetical protein
LSRKHSGGVVDVKDFPGDGRFREKLAQQPLDLLGDWLAAGLAVLGVILRHPDPDLFVEPHLGVQRG